jgi:hypothetical protein
MRREKRQLTLGFAILGQKQYPSAFVRYLASARAEVFQCSFLFLSSLSVFQLGSGSGRKIFKFPNIEKPYRWLQARRRFSNLMQLLLFIKIIDVRLTL